MKKTTLFQTGNDLSSEFVCVNRTLKANNFDIYTMLEDSDVTINHSTKRGPSELIESDPIRGNMYVAGIAYDVFSVWVKVEHADPATGRPGCSKCIAEDLLSFDDALTVASEFIQDLQFEEVG